MKRMKFSIVEKKLIRMIIIFIILQALIIAVFLFELNGSYPINIQDTEQVDIVVEDIYYYRTRSGYKLCVVSDSNNYLFLNRSTFKEYSPSKLYRTISVGDRLSLVCYQTNIAFFGESNIVIEARTETETYRSYEEYLKGMKGAPVANVVIYTVIEVIFVGAVFVYVWINQNIIKEFFKKVKRYKRNKQKKTD